MPELPRPTPKEMIILRTLWRLGPSPVRDVHEAVLARPDAKQVGYTTTLKLMQMMLEKGLLLRDESEQRHVYRPAISEQENVAEVLDQIVRTTYQGSRSRLVMQLLGQKKPDKAELRRIREFLDDLEDDLD